MLSKGDYELFKEEVVTASASPQKGKEQNSWKKILVVDDEPNICQLARYCLEDSFQVFTTSKSSEVVSTAAREHPDLILLDIMMPQMSGIECARQLKLHPTTKNIPIIFLSAKDRLQDVTEAMAAGGIDYITKPFEPEELSKRIQKHLVK